MPPAPPSTRSLGLGTISSQLLHLHCGQHGEHLIQRVLQGFSKIKVPPSIQWTSISVFLRTLWTNVKEARTVRNQASQAPVTSTCSNCGLSPERTRHLLYQCPLAQQVWTYLIDEINELASINNPTQSLIPLTSDLVLFNHTPNILSDQLSTDLLQTVMTVKLLIYRFKF